MLFSDFRVTHNKKIIINLYITNSYSLDEYFDGNTLIGVILEDNVEDFIWKNRNILSPHI